MGIVGIGVDMCQVSRWEALLDRSPGAAGRVLTPAERELPPRSQAARFAAKEALAKAIPHPDVGRWLEVEIQTRSDGSPRVTTSGRLSDIVAELRITNIHLSLSHDGDFAIAMVVCES